MLVKVFRLGRLVRFVGFCSGLGFLVLLYWLRWLVQGLYFSGMIFGVRVMQWLAVRKRCTWVMAAMRQCLMSVCSLVPLVVIRLPVSMRPWSVMIVLNLVADVLGSVCLDVQFLSSYLLVCGLLCRQQVETVRLRVWMLMLVLLKLRMLRCLVLYSRPLVRRLVRRGRDVDCVSSVLHLVRTMCTVLVTILCLLGGSVERLLASWLGMPTSIALTCGRVVLGGTC